MFGLFFFACLDFFLVGIFSLFFVCFFAFCFFFEETFKRFKSIQKTKKYSKDLKVQKVNFEILWPWFLVFCF